MVIIYEYSILSGKDTYTGVVWSLEIEPSLPHGRYLQLNELAVEDIVWVDEVDGLCDATSHIEGCKVAGLDCEWKPNYEKGSKPNKVKMDCLLYFLAGDLCNNFYPCHTPCSFK